MPAAIRLTIAGKRWTIKFVRKIMNGGVECDGLCVYGKCEIRIRSGLSGQDLADTLAHEVMHAAGWNLHEEFVDQTATDIAAALYHPDIRGRI